MGEALDRNGIENNGDWLFWSGFSKSDPLQDFRDSIRAKSIRHTWKTPNDLEMDKNTAPEKWKFWAYNSQALGQFVKGDIIVVLPKGRPANKPYPGGEGSNFWTYALPELVRRPNEVNSIYTVEVPINKDGSPDMKEIETAYGNRKKRWAPNDQIAKDLSTWPAPGNPDVKPTQDAGPDWRWPE